MAEFAWRSMDSIPPIVPEEAPVLFLARVENTPYEVKAKDQQIYKPVVGYGSERGGWRDLLLGGGEASRREISITPICWAEIPMPLPYPPRL
jgi:hypothetical protein